MQDLIETSDDSNDTKIRLLICHDCQVIVPIQDYQGHPDRDEQLHARVTEHQYPGSRPTRGHDMDLGRVSEKSWNDPQRKQSILAQLQEELGVGRGEGLGVDNYAHKDNFMEDAMKCWRFKHGRTSNCADYIVDKMLILSDSREERKDLGLDPKARATVKLCQFCVYHSVVQSRKNKARGYN